MKMYEPVQAVYNYNGQINVSRTREVPRRLAEQFQLYENCPVYFFEDGSDVFFTVELTTLSAVYAITVVEGSWLGVNWLPAEDCHKVPYAIIQMERLFAELAVKPRLVTKRRKT